MNSYFGTITIIKISNRQLANSSGNKDDYAFIPFGESNIRFEHYPDCQQLIVWLPHPGSEYGKLRLVNNKSKLIEEWPVADRLNGSIQLILDTLPIAPGLYTIEIDWKNGWQHQIYFEKHNNGEAARTIQHEGAATKVKSKIEQPEIPIIYRDGFGEIIENTDLILRENVHKDIARRFSRRIEYKDNGRSGSVIYTDNTTRIEFFYEMGGGKCMVYIELPTNKQWEARTNTPLSARQEIVEFVTTTVQAQQASNCEYEIREDAILFYYK